MSGLIRYDVSFRIGDDKLDPLEVTEMLGIVPDIAHRKDAPNTSISKKGKLIEFAPFNTGLWCINSKIGECEDLEHHLKSLLLLLYPLRDKLAGLTGRGYKMDMFCGAFTHEAGKPGFSINPSVLLQMGEMNIEFGICIY